MNVPFAHDEISRVPLELSFHASHKDMTLNCENYANGTHIFRAGHIAAGFLHGRLRESTGVSDKWLATACLPRRPSSECIANLRLNGMPSRYRRSSPAHSRQSYIARFFVHEPLGQSFRHKHFCLANDLPTNTFAGLDNSFVARGNPVPAPIDTDRNPGSQAGR